MPSSKSNTKREPRPKPTTNLTASTSSDVLTLAETAEYLRVTEKEVVRLVREQGLPGRKLGEDWRFLKSALQHWLQSPPSKKEALLMQIGAFEDDPDLGEMLERILRQRGRQEKETD